MRMGMYVFSACLAAVLFLERVQKQIKDAKLARDEAQPLLFIGTHIADFQLHGGQVSECKALQEANRKQLDVLQDVRSSADTLLHICPSNLHCCLATA